MNITEIISKVLATPNAAFFYTPPIYGKSDSYLFLKPKEIVTIKSLKNLNEKLNRIDAVSYTHLTLADERSSVDLGGRRIIKKKTKTESV